MFTSPPAVVEPQGGPPFVAISKLLAEAQWAMQKVEIGTLDRNEIQALRLMVNNIGHLLGIHDQAGAMPTALVRALKGTR